VAAFYPFHWPLYFVPEENIGAWLSWLVVLHVLIAGWGMHAYAGSKGLGRLGRFVAALGYMFAGKWLLHVLVGGHYIMAPLAWLPWVLLFLEQSFRRHSLARALSAGVVFALILLGTHPQMTLYAGVLVALWSSISLRAQTSAGRPGDSVPWCSRPWARWMLHGLLAFLVAASLSAVQLLPALEATPQTSRAGGVLPRDILAAAFPSLLGLVGPGWTQSWEDRGGLGVLWIAAALMARLLYRDGGRSEMLACLFLLGVSFGGAVLFYWFAGFQLFQIPVRMLVLLAAPISLLAGKTTDFLVIDATLLNAEPRQRCRRVLMQTFLVACVLAGMSAWAHYQTELAIHRSVLDWLR